MKTAKTFRASQSSIQAIEALHGNISAGAQAAIECYLSLRARTLHDLQGTFSEKELSYLVDMLNGTIFDPSLSVNSSVLIASIEDSDRYNRLGQKWGVDVEALIKKAGELSSAQALFLTEEINMFWYGKEGQDLQAFIEKYSPKTGKE